MSTDSPPFRFWLRRSAAGEDRCALRFEVFEGTGVLRVARPGVLIDPPARESGYEADLTLAQVRASRFLHLQGIDRRRQLYFLSRIADELVRALEVERWVELAAAVDRGARHLLLRGADGAVVVDLGAGSAESAPTEPRFPSGLVTLPPDALTPLGDEDAARRSQEPRPPPASASAATAPRPPATAPPTALIRYLRRELATARAENRALNARVRNLEARLAALDGLPELGDPDLRARSTDPTGTRRLSGR